MAVAAHWLAQDSTALFKKAAQFFLETVSNSIRDRGQAAVALAGGSTPKKLFELLTESYYAARIDWSKLHLFWVDERCVPPHHPESNFGMTQAALLSKVPIPATHVHRMAGEMSSPQEAAKAYENELKSFFKVTQSPPAFDLILLGVGEDGHIASLFPKSESLNETGHWVVASQVEKITAHRVTLTLPVINNARRILFLLSGASKAEILKKIMMSEGASTRLPALLVQPSSGEVFWLFDQDAASKLPPEVRYKTFHI